MKHLSLPDRPADYANGITTEYRGYTITDTFDVVKGGKVIWDNNISIAQAKSIIDQSEALRNRPCMQTSLRKLWGACELENGQEQREREAERVNEFYENQNYEHEQRY